MVIELTVAYYLIAEIILVSTDLTVPARRGCSAQHSGRSSGLHKGTLQSLQPYVVRGGLSLRWLLPVVGSRGACAGGLLLVLRPFSIQAIQASATSTSSHGEGPSW